MHSRIKKYLYLFPLVLIASAFSCSTPPPHAESTSNTLQSQFNEPAIFYTSLADSLSVKAMETLKLSDVTGIKVKYLNGTESRYFEYTAEKQSAIRAVSQLPFTKYCTVSDTHCRRISIDDIVSTRQTISATEYEHSAFFWNADPTRVEVYECIKSPFRHTLLIDSKSNHVIHRIEVLG